MTAGTIVQDRLGEIARHSSTSKGVTRLPYSEQHRTALEQIEGWMTAAGMTSHLDDAGTLAGRTDGKGPALLIGSHQDSVHSGGRYDGIMGIAIGCMAVELLRSENRLPSFPLEVLAFADEEGVRFPTALIGSRALAGAFDPAVLEMRDRDGISIRDALISFGCTPDAIPVLARDPSQTRGYLEIHIEQGPVLEAGGHGLGIVTGICGIERSVVTFRGETGHAGTVPMPHRHDALVSAAAFITRIQALALETEGLMATVGTLELLPGAVNAIPDHCALTLEVRAMDGALRDGFAQQAEAIGREIASTQGTALTFEKTYAQGAVPCSEGLMNQLESAVARVQNGAPRLPSGATHDASAMAQLTDIAMLFVRCRGGLSHRPDEHVSAEDLDLAIRATADFITGLDAK